MKSRQPNGAGTLYREKGRGWCAQVHVKLPDGFNRRVKGRGATPEEAIKARNAKVAKLLAGNPAGDRMTVRELSEKWTGRAKAKKWTAETVRSYRVALDKHILPRIGNVRLANLKGYHPQKVLDGIMADSDDEHWSVANRSLRTMRAMFGQGVKWGLLGANPALGVDAVEEPQIERARWTKAEAVRFLEAAEGSRYRDLYHAAIVSGLRVGELLVLRWSDVTAEGFTVRRSWSQSTPGKIQAYTKSKRIRRVPIPDGLRDRLEARRGEPDELVFPRPGGELANPSTIRKELLRLIAIAEVPVLRFHDLRVTYSSILAEMGLHPSVIQKLLGHSTPHLAMKVYTNISQSVLDSAVIDLGGQNGGSPHGHDAHFGVNMSVGGLGESEAEPLN